MTDLRQILIDDRWLTLRRVVLAVIWITLAILTHIPVPQAVQELRVSDKLVHCIAYFPLGLLLPTCRVRGTQRHWVCLLIVASYGILDELLQIPVGRTASVLDWLADVIGAALGVWLVAILGKR